MVHLLLLGAVSTAILIWSQHFADTLVRRPALSGRRSLIIRLAGHTVGAILVLVGMTVDLFAVVLVGGIIVGAVAVLHAVLLGGQLRRAKPTRFGSLVRYYVAAAASLAVGVLAAGVVVAAGASLAGLPLGVGAGALLYLLGLMPVVREAVRQAGQAPPTTFAGWSLAASIAWLAFSVGALGWLVAPSPPTARCARSSRARPSSIPSPRRGPASGCTTAPPCRAWCRRAYPGRSVEPTAGSWISSCPSSPRVASMECHICDALSAAMRGAFHGRSVPRSIQNTRTIFVCGPTMSILEQLLHDNRNDRTGTQAGRHQRHWIC
ncbi:hypothetical protein [Cryobacterium glaciale]|uniref:hypothetical protein n=1 Tax=Cryobacterium glaciale TaxID=1259145 RepID=UPI00141B6D4D|nr:hypothetical protein [Cryobacterium glaciale]